MHSCKHWCFVESASSRHCRLCIASPFFPCDCMVHHIAFLPLGASVQGCSIWNQRHFNGVITRAFIKRQLQSSRMRPKGKGKHHRFGYMGKGKAKGTSRDDTNLSNTESRGETTNPEQDPVKIESERERVRRRPSQRRKPLSCQRQVMHTAVSCKLPARLCSLACWSQHFTGFFSTFAVNQVWQSSHSVLSVLDTPVDSDRPCSHSNGIMLHCH